MQSVPRTMTYSPELETLLIMPIEEVADLRTRQLAKTTVPALKPTPVSVPGAGGATLDIAANFTCGGAASAGRNCSAGLRVRVSEDASSFLEVSFACPAERTADCQVPGPGLPKRSCHGLAEGVRIVSGR